ncbi:class I SAM-dependent methyltransferase [Aquimarina algiphila]|uniref:class I SAM-dependent methyltransferase n=1 Tax=Aquimarina algiphila TaxID=2047982 RepID=UPI00232BCCC1|nr:class I SAM-dependent methyltransferase [Aquimarina algiphila]
MKRSMRFLIFSILVLGMDLCSAQYKQKDWEERDTWMNVPELLKLTGVTTGSVVADIGSHEGYLTIHLSKQVNKAGKVYAVDVRKDRLEQLDKHLEERKITNVKTILGDYDNPKLPKQSLNVVIVMDTYHEIDDYMKVLDHIKTSLKPDGRIMILEKFKSHVRNKSREEQTDEHTISLRFVKSELEKAGFSISKEIKDFGNWKNESNKKMWILVGVVR